jgi:hypothetical protein
MIDFHGGQGVITISELHRIKWPLLKMRGNTKLPMMD